MVDATTYLGVGRQLTVRAFILSTVRSACLEVRAVSQASGRAVYARQPNPEGLKTIAETLDVVRCLDTRLR